MIRGADGQAHAVLQHAGTRGIWHDGWFANTVHAASPAGWSNFDKDRWELYHIDSDRSQCHDLAAENPEKLAELTNLWFAEAAWYNGLPLADLNIFETLGRWRPYLVADRQTSTYYPDTPRSAWAPRSNCVGSPSRCWPRPTWNRRPPTACVQHGAGHGGACAVPGRRPSALRLQLHGRGRATGVGPGAGPPGITSSVCATTGPAPWPAVTRPWES